MKMARDGRSSKKKEKERRGRRREEEERLNCGTCHATVARTGNLVSPPALLLLLLLLPPLPLFTTILQ